MCYSVPLIYKVIYIVSLGMSLLLYIRTGNIKYNMRTPRAGEPLKLYDSVFYPIKYTRVLGNSGTGTGEQKCCNVRVHKSRPSLYEF